MWSASTVPGLATYADITAILDHDLSSSMLRQLLSGEQGSCTARPIDLGLAETRSPEDLLANDHLSVPRLPLTQGE